MKEPEPGPPAVERLGLPAERLGLPAEQRGLSAEQRGLLAEQRGLLAEQRERLAERQAEQVEPMVLLQLPLPEETRVDLEAGLPPKLRRSGGQIMTG